MEMRVLVKEQRECDLHVDILMRKGFLVNQKSSATAVIRTHREHIAASSSAETLKLLGLFMSLY